MRRQKFSFGFRTCFLLSIRCIDFAISTIDARAGWLFRRSAVDEVRHIIAAFSAAISRFR